MRCGRSSLIPSPLLPQLCPLVSRCLLPLGIRPFGDDFCLLPSPLQCGSRHPEVLWAQRSDKIYLTVTLPDAKDVVVKCEPEGVFSFTALGAQGGSFQLNLELYEAIVPEGSKTKIGLRNIICSIQKQNKGWWKRLLKSEGKPAPYIKVDWNKWCDEDEEEFMLDSEEDETGGDGSDDETSDEDGLLYLPDLEKARGN